MAYKFAYISVFGYPLIIYLGIAVITSLFATAAVPLLNKRRAKKIPVVWHFRLAGLTSTLALVHGITGIMAYL
ncbi:hypothetical protein F1737_08595 [Methanoplanus sp. FWC-SCC4]|uniref:Uncharacterized protein n=1 Tax=Methanochimaera problematica TaxID=2609417 RepID=A0AA97FEH1_9EURY|nr:hypothetical protein [Methanoplanus sp. FWC-SCC4]WOF16744.1 hypothetical protein F1737_08595 [Methanoplanus sp. FWC-SCC4]